MRRAYVEGRFGQVHLRLAGSDAPGRRPMMCVHLSPVSGVIYENWIREIGRDRLAVAPDTPGYGMSDPPATPPDIADYAGAMWDVADALGLRDLDVMGYHTGSRICVEMARLQPGRVKHLVLVSTPIYTAEELAQQREFNSMSDPDPEGRFLVRAWQDLLRWQDRRATPATTLRQFPDHLRGGEHRGWGHRAAFAHTYPGRIESVTAPILVLNPDDDLGEYTPRIGPHLTNGRVKDLPGWSHQFLDLSTTEVAAMVRPFLDEDRWPD